MSVPLASSHVIQFLVVSILKHPRTPMALGMMDYQNNDHEQLMKRLRTPQSVDEVFTAVWHVFFSMWLNLPSV